MEATKEEGAMAVASGREMPPAVAGRRSWKEVRLSEGVVREVGSRRRTAARAVMACVLAAEESEGASGVAGEGWVVMVGGVRRKWWLKVVWGRRHRMRMRVAPWAWTPGMEVK